MILVIACDKRDFFIVLYLEEELHWKWKNAPASAWYGAPGEIYRFLLLFSRLSISDTCWGEKWYFFEEGFESGKL